MVRVQSFVSISLAKEFGFTVHGIDIFPPFVREAGAEVARAGLEYLCTFQSGDVRDVVQTARGYDIVVFAGAGGVLGDLAATVCSLRQVVRSGGYIVIEDGYLRDLSRSVSTEWAYYREHDETVQQLTSCGDVMIREVEISDEENNYSEQLRSEYIAVTDGSLCADCGTCEGSCFFEARRLETGSIQLVQEQCFGCGKCLESCPEGAISLERQIGRGISLSTIM